MGVSVVISELSKIEQPDTKMKQMGMITPFLVTTRLLAELATEERKRHADIAKSDKRRAIRHRERTGRIMTYWELLGVHGRYFANYDAI